MRRLRGKSAGVPWREYLETKLLWAKGPKGWMTYRNSRLLHLRRRSHVPHDLDPMRKKHAQSSQSLQSSLKEGENALSIRESGEYLVVTGRDSQLQLQTSMSVPTSDPDGSDTGTIRPGVTSPTIQEDSSAPQSQAQEHEEDREDREYQGYQEYQEYPEHPEYPEYREYEEEYREHHQDHIVPQPDEGLDQNRLLNDRLLIATKVLLEEQRGVSAKRSQVRESRLALRYKRDEETKYRAQLMKDLNSLFATHSFPGSELILEKYQRLQIATEEYLSMENNYHREEDELETQEYLLAQSMDEFAGNSPYTPETEDKSKSSQEMPACVVNYLSRIGDERLLRERLSNLESNWIIIMEQRNQKSDPPIAQEVDEDAEHFLRTFDEEWKKAWKDLNHTQLDVNQLRVICLEQGLHGFDYEDLGALFDFTDFPQIEDDDPLKLQEPEYFYIDEAYLDKKPTGSDTSLQNYSFVFDELENVGKFASNEFINKWILHQLRISSIGIWQLQSLVDWQPLRDQGWDNHDISQRTLEEWFHDKPNRQSSPTGPSSNNDASIITIKQVTPFSNSKSLSWPSKSSHNRHLRSNSSSTI